MDEAQKSTVELDALRYPVGPMPMPATTTPEERSHWIEEIDTLPRGIAEALRGVTERELETPYRPGGWTLHQVVHHLADSHMNGLIRLKLALTEDRPVIKPYDEAKWAELGDMRLPVEVSVQILAGVNGRWAALLRTLSEQDVRREFQHPEMGPVRIEQHMALYAWHGRHHLAHIHLALREAGR